MKKTNAIFFGLTIATFLIIGCKKNEDNTKDISKEGSVETVITVNHLENNLDMIQTTYKVWVKNTLVNTFVHNDTIPSLGTTTETDDEGNSTGLPYQKDYEVFITVK